MESTNIKIYNYSSSSVKDFIILMKPRVMLLVVFSAITGLIIAPGTIHPLLAIVSILCISAGAGAAASINMWYDIDIDSIMQRTKMRPTVTGKIPKDEALAFGIMLTIFSVFMMAICINYLASILLLFTIGFYVFIYTIWLKRSSVQNIVIGGASGAFPPMIGWVSVTNQITIEPILLFCIIFFWTPAHFWSLALYKVQDYSLANVPIMPIIKGDRYTKWNILLYTILTIIASFSLYFVHAAGIFFFMCSIIIGAIFIYFAVILLRDASNTTAPKMFFYSILYLFFICAALICDNLLRH